MHVKNETSQIKNQPPLVHYKEESIHMDININFMGSHIYDLGHLFGDEFSVIHVILFNCVYKRR
jgi:hypothetical protein